MFASRLTEKLNLNISAYRVLYILLLLGKHRFLSLKELNSFLVENPLICRAYNSETITKYINTLRKVGCKIPPANKKNGYELTKNPFPLNLTDEEVSTAVQLLVLLGSFPDEELHHQYQSILKKVAWALCNERQERILLDSANVVVPTAIQNQRELITRFKRYCEGGLVLSLLYAGEQEPQVEMTIEPNRVLQEGRKFYLLGNERNLQKEVKLNLENISSVKQLPYKFQNRVRQIGVIFELTGRLARTYRPYPGESVLSHEAGSLKIKAKTDDYASLLTRLMKYGTACRIESPHYVAEEMIQKINSLLATLKASSGQYEQSGSPV